MSPAVRITMPYPPSVNRYWRSVRVGKKCHVILSREAWAYRDRVQAFHTPITFEQRCPQGPLRVAIVLHPPDRRKRDVDNALKAILDALQYIHAISDDSQICDLRVVRAEPVKGGRAEVEISKAA